MRELRHERAKSTAELLVRTLAARDRWTSGGGVQLLPMGAPIDMSPETWRGDDRPDGVLYAVPTGGNVRGGSVQVLGSLGQSRIVAALESELDFERVVLLAVTAESASAGLLIRDTPNGVYRSEITVGAQPSEVDVYLITVSPSTPKRE